ncbi:MAG: hypothetical protein ACRCUJ_03470 [Phocaeicola sp.]
MFIHIYKLPPYGWYSGVIIRPYATNQQFNSEASTIQLRSLNKEVTTIRMVFGA